MNVFTGIIKEVGTVESLSRRGKGALITIKCKEVLSALKEGDSVGVNGVCLTCEDVGKRSFSASLLSETLKATNLKTTSVGSMVNLEPSVRVGDSLGGHFVFGHVDDSLRVLALNKRSQGLEADLAVALPEKYKAFVLPSASVALNGVSLTVRKVSRNAFWVNLVSYTLTKTNLSRLKRGDEVNVEFDLLVKSAYHTISLILKYGKSNFEGISNLGNERSA